MIPSNVVDWRNENLNHGLGEGDDPTVVIECLLPGRDMRIMLRLSQFRAISARLDTTVAEREEEKKKATAA